MLQQQNRNWDHKKIKQEPILAVGNSGQSNKRFNRDQFRKRQPNERTNKRKETMQ